MTMKIVFAEPQLPESGALAVGIAADRVLTPAAAALDEASGGAVGRALAASPRFTGKREDLLALAGLPAGVPGRVVLAGLGDPASVDGPALQRIGGVLAAHFGQTGVAAAAIRLDGLGRQGAAAAGRRRRDRLRGVAADLPLRQVPHQAKSRKRSPSLADASPS